jgi:hypothetical protein
MDRLTEQKCPSCGHAFFWREIREGGGITLRIPAPLHLRVLDEEKNLSVVCGRCGKHSPAPWMDEIDHVFRSPLPDKRSLSEAALIGDAHRTISAKSSIGPIREVAEVFAANIERMIALVELAPLATGLTFLAGSNNLRSALVIAGVSEEIESSEEELHIEETKLYTPPLSTEIKREAMRCGYGRLREWSDSHAEMIPGVEAVLFSQIVLAWTAFETLAGDLWEAAINHHPHILARLDGPPKRIGKLAGAKEKEQPDDEDEGNATTGADSADSKSVSLIRIHDLSKGSCDLGKLMGSLLKKRFKFTTLGGIRKAYSVAFSKKSTAVDAALSKKHLDGLSLIRNLIVHRAGVADTEYEERAKSVPDIPHLTDGQRLELTGKLSRSLIEPAILSAVDLVGAVNEWITR